jgi:hypothetical protein
VKRIEITFIVLSILFCSYSAAQRVELKGQLIANDEVEGIHILNKTAAKYDISNEKGQFIIPAKVNDTIYISGLKYIIKEVIVNTENVNTGIINVNLEEKINELDQVVVGKIFTGSLQSDIENSDAKPEINFYDLGLPGSTKLPMTQNERKLFDAGSGPTAMIMGGPFGGGLGVNFHKLLNAISGRTKKLKNIVELDNRDKCITRLRREYETIIFENDSLADNLKTEFFLFAQETDGFLQMCNRKNDIEAIIFLKDKLKAYQFRRETEPKD